MLWVTIRPAVCVLFFVVVFFFGGGGNGAFENNIWILTVYFELSYLFDKTCLEKKAK